MADEDDIETALDEDETEGLVPFALELTPASLGKQLGEDHVLPWLLEQAASGISKADLQSAIGATCLSHIASPKDRRDMANHVVQGLHNYLLVDFDDDGRARLTHAGEDVHHATDADRDRVFALHILTMCNGYRLVEAIQRFELRGERPSLEALTEELDRSATSKSISTMKAWLQRACVMKPGRAYAINEAGLERVLGASSKKLLGLDPPEVEFLLAARILVAQQSSPVLEAPDVKLVAESRRPDVRLPSKMLGGFVKGLVGRGLLLAAPTVRGKGGKRVAVELAPPGFDLTDDQIRSFVKQAGAGMLLSDLKKLDDVVQELAVGNAETLGRLGEMLAVHACLMLGLRVIGWRTRAPVEVDLTAERTIGLAYQRWHVQVKNVAGDLDADRVDREIGAAAGTAATHILFVVPRGGVTAPARAEITSKNRLTHLHVYSATKESFEPPIKTGKILRELLGQEAHLSRIKRREAERRERLL